MSRRKHPQEPHYGNKNKLRRLGKTIYPFEGEAKFFPSIRQARRYMRTGRATRG